MICPGYECMIKLTEFYLFYMFHCVVDLYFISYDVRLGTGMIASSSAFRPHPGRVIRDLSRLLNAVYGIVRKQ